MSQTAILFPALCQAILTLVVLILLGPARARSMREKGQRLDDADVRLGQNAWSEQATKISNNYRNQFEVPVLFYAAAGFALALRQVDAVLLGLAWVFALSRIAHSLVHIGPNVVPLRAVVFLIGVLAVLVMWVLLGVRVWVGG